MKNASLKLRYFGKEFLFLDEIFCLLTIKAIQPKLCG